jgi:FkbM family methyltransferase
MRFVSWQVRSRLSDTVVVPWVEGTRLIAEHGMTGATGNIYCGLHEFVDMAFVLHYLGPDDTFLDIGANIGSYTILASGVRKARTIAFEPDPETALKLRRNIDTNNLNELVVLHEVALGSSDGDVSFTVGQDTINHVAAPNERNIRTVPLRTLDSIVEGGHAVLMKMDVEGYEAQVLGGAKQVLSSPQLLAVVTEGHDPTVVDALTSHGFQRFWYDPFNREIFDEPGAFPSANALFLRRIDSVKARIAAAPRLNVLGVEL